MNISPPQYQRTVIITIKGSLKLSNCAAKTRKIISREIIMANIRLSELSRNSFDSPDNAVQEASRKCFGCNPSISSNPSPIVYPLASPDEIVAATNGYTGKVEAEQRFLPGLPGYPAESFHRFHFYITISNRLAYFFCCLFISPKI